jgi:uncharacterized protein YbjT (DUF2867 family)
MSKTLIIGASGQIGKMTTELLVEYKHDVVALVRNKNKLNDLNSAHLTIIEQDLESDFNEVVKDCEQVIFVAGSGGSTGADKTLLIDLWAATKAINFSKEHGVKHFIMVSSLGADDPDAIQSNLKPYLVAKHMADKYLINSGLNYTIVRPGALTNESASMLISTTRPADRSDAKISRENVAHVLFNIAQNPWSSSCIFELFDGDKAIKAAVK